MSGGVADHVLRLSDELLKRGHEVEVWAPGSRVGAKERPYHHACDFRGAALAELDGAIRKTPRTRVLLHYVPLTFGRFNPAFMRWLSRCRNPLWVMFHEVAYPLRWRQRFRHRVLGVMTHWTARTLAGRADRVLVSTPSFEPLLRRLSPSLGPVHWLPISSNIPEPDDGRDAVVVRRELGLSSSDLLVVHFGTFREGQALLGGVIRRLLEDPRVHVAILGRGAEEYTRKVDLDSHLRLRVHSVGQSPASRVAELIAAADLGLYPFVDGVTTRRTSLMAALSLAKPVVTTVGATTEPIWFETDAVRLVEPNAEKLARAARELLADEVSRRALGGRAKLAYQQNFAVRCAADSLEALLSAV
jgi:glycosyltransferase involved in cell wall biosynthesis